MILGKFKRLMSDEHINNLSRIVLKYECMKMNKEKINIELEDEFDEVKRIKMIINHEYNMNDVFKIDKCQKMKV